MKRSLISHQDMVALAAMVLLVLAFLFGGASRDHALRLALVELAAVPVLCLAMHGLLVGRLWREHRFALGLAAAVAALPLAQLIPLPPSIWQDLPGRDQLLLALAVTGIEPGWAPLSMTPDETWRSFLALLPPMAMFLALLAVRRNAREALLWLVLIGTATSLALAVLQLASGDERFYPWATTSAGALTGFFANRNHLATLVLVSMPVVAAFAGARMRRRGGLGGYPAWAASIYLGAAIVALAAIRSRAGVALAGPSIILSLAIVWIAGGRGRPNRQFLAIVATAIVALGVAGAFALAPLMARFDTAPVTEGRYENWPLVARAAETHLPLGSGLGSFDPVYRSVEPLERLDSTFFNHAHNEYLEIWLETGWPGVILLVVFLVWWGRRSLAVWFQDRMTTGLALQCAASGAVLIMLLHSAVDYPLRTETLAVILALFCGVLENRGDPSDRRGNGARMNPS